MSDVKAWAAEADLWAAFVCTLDDPAVVRGLVETSEAVVAALVHAAATPLAARHG